MGRNRRLRAGAGELRADTCHIGMQLRNITVCIKGFNLFLEHFGKFYRCCSWWIFY